MNHAHNKRILHKATLLAALLLVLLPASIALADGWSLKDKDGVHYTLSGLQGRWVLVNFWAPWCEPCLQEMPDLVALQQQHKDMQVLGIAVMYQSRQKVTDVVNRLSISYPVVFGNEDTAADFGELVGLPTSFLYSPSGKLVGRIEGPVTQADIERRIH